MTQTFKLKSFGSLNLTLIIIGALLRLNHYIQNRALWLDEAYVAVALTSRTFKEIVTFFPFFYEQANLPLFFELVIKSLTVVLGEYEFVLRLVPFLASIVSIVLFYKLIRRWLEGPLIPVALGLFITCDALVYYAAELKPYQMDVLMALVLYLLVASEEKLESIRHIFLIGIVGAVGLWFSHAYVFVYPGVSFVLGCYYLFQKKFKHVGFHVLSTIPFFISFAVLYKVSFNVMANNVEIIDAWDPIVFLTVPLFSKEGISWVWSSWHKMFGDPGGFVVPVAVNILFIIGCVYTFMKNKLRLVLLLVPILLALLASIMGKYPYSGRMLLFFVPGLMIILTHGLWFAQTKIPKPVACVVSSCLIAFLFFNPLKSAAYFLTHDRPREDSRGVVEFLNEYYTPGDEILMNPSAQYPYWYYMKLLGLSQRWPKEVIGIHEGELVRGIKIGQFSRFLGEIQGKQYTALRDAFHVYNDEGYFMKFLSTTKHSKPRLIVEGVPFKYSEGKRVWLMFSNVDPVIERIVKDAFDRKGRIIKELELQKAAIYLYDMSS